MKGLRAAELFAGVGGFRLGLEKAGIDVVWSNQWEPATKKQHASEIYVAQFGARGHVNDDIAVSLDALERDERLLPKVDLVVGGFPCFAPGTLILTAAGYRPIEDVREGDLVLTHLGRWRSVTSVMRRQAERSVIIRGQGIPDVRTTDEHPFWARRCFSVWSPTLRRNVREFDEPGWVEAQKVVRGTFVSQVLPAEPLATAPDLDLPDAFYWLVGRYLADGWRTTSNGKGRVVICAAKHEAEDVLRRILAVVHCTPSPERTVIKFHITRKGLYDWLEPFGTGAAGKRIPGWLFTIDPQRARSLLEGYFSGDGSPYQDGWKATTVSRALALGIALLCQRAHGVVASVYQAEVPPTKLIEGRLVNQRKQYHVVLPPRNRSAFVEGSYGWKLVRSNDEGGPTPVFNIAVDEDNSYVADGCVVHNCQDYSVARSLNGAKGIEGRKGVLWWQIYRLLDLRLPRYVIFENVDRLLGSPVGRRGRDFAIILASLCDLGYRVEWRVVNAADYGAPQRRRRIFIVGVRQAADAGLEVISRTGLLARALPVRASPIDTGDIPDLTICGDLPEISNDPRWSGTSPFLGGGFASERRVWTRSITPKFRGRARTLADILVPDADVPEAFVVPREQVSAWRYLKGAKREPRTATNGHAYVYTEGAVAFPDPIDRPSRTILTGEGGSTPSRFKHVVEMGDGRLRRLLPVELERLNGFPDGWTEHPGVRDGRRAFLMGNALVVPIVERIARAIAADAAVARAPRARPTPGASAAP